MTFAYGVRERVVTLEHPAMVGMSLAIEQCPESATPACGDGTGRRLWPTALALSRLLCDRAELVRGKAAVELGSGAGLVGLVCAALGASRVVLTDVADSLGLLHHNVASNASAIGACTVSVEPLTWGDDDALQTVLRDGGFDVVLACEVVYKQEADVLESLARTQRALVHGGDDGRIFLAYEFRGRMLEDMAYSDEADRIFARDCESISLREYNAADEEEDSRWLYTYRLPQKPALRAEV